MAIYGQMTSRTKATEEEEEEEGEVKDKLREVTTEASKDLEQVLSELSVSIDNIEVSTPPQPRPTEAPHLTLGSSSTNRRAPETSPPGDTTIV